MYAIHITDFVHANTRSADEKGKTGKKRATLYMVTPYMDHDLSGMLTNPNIHFSGGQIKCYLLQLLEGLRYLHDVSVMHSGRVPAPNNVFPVSYSSSRHEGGQHSHLQ